MTPRPKGPRCGLAALSIAGVWTIALVGAVVLFIMWLLGIDWPR